MAQKAIVFGSQGAAVSALASGLVVNQGTLEVVFRRTATSPYPGRRVLAGVYLTRGGMTQWAPIYGLLADGMYPYARVCNTQTWGVEAIQSTHTTPTTYEHWAMTWDIQAGAVALKIYRNGTEVSATLNVNDVNNVRGPLNTGAQALVALGSIASTAMSESFLECRLWNTVRTAQQISDANMRPLTEQEIASSALIGYWKPETTDANGDSAVGDVLADDKGSADLTVETAATWASDTPVAFDAPAADTTPPTPGTISETSKTTTTVVVNVGAGEDDVEVTGRTLRVYSDVGLTTKVGGDIAASTGDNTVSGLTQLTPYWFVCAYRDAAGNTANSNVLNVTTSAPAADSTPPTPGTVTISGITQNGATATVGAGSDTNGIASRTLRVYSDEALTTKVLPDITAVTGANSITGLQADTDYWVTCTYADPAGNTAVSTTATFTTSAAPAAYPAVLAVRGSATLGQAGMWATGYDIPANATDGGFTFMATAKWGAWDTTWLATGGSYHLDYFRLVDSTGKVRFRMARNASPWFYLQMGNGTANSPSVTEIYKGSQPKSVYDTFWFVYKPPTAQTAGYIRVYINGDGSWHSDTLAWDHALAAGSTPIDWGGGALKLEIGQPTPQSYSSVSNQWEDMNVAEVALWGIAKDGDRAAAGTYNPWGVSPTMTRYRSASLKAWSQADLLALPSNDISREDLLLYFSPTTAHLGANVPVAMGSLSTVELASNGANATLSSDTPAWLGVSSTTPPTDCTLGAITPTSSGCTIASVTGGTVQGAATGYCKRTVYVSKGNAYRDLYVLRQSLPADGTLRTALAITGLAAGTPYRVTVAWEDNLGNITTQTATFTTTGTATAVSGRRSLALTGLTVTKHPLAKIPTNEGVTIRAFVRRNTGDAGSNSGSGRVVFGIDDALNDASNPPTLGYQRAQLRIFNDGAASIYYGDGEILSGTDAYLTSGSTLAIGTWVECWIQMRPPKVGQTGEVAIKIGDAARVTRTLPAVTSREQDLFWHKWPLHMRVGTTSGEGMQANVSDITLWSRYLTDADILAIKGKDVGALDASTAYREDIVAHWQGSGSGAADPFTPAYGQAVGASGFDLAMPLGSNVAYSTDVPNFATVVEPPSNVLLLTPMARSCSVQLNIDTQGGGNVPATSLVEWRVPGGTWKKAYPLQRVMNDHLKTSKPAVPLMATIIMGLQEGQTYEVRATLTGTGYAGVASLPQTFTTLTSTPPAGTGGTIVITVDESTTSAQIWTALNTALSASNPSANAGKVVEFRSANGPGVRTVVRAAIAGLYATGGNYWKWSGTSDAWLTVRQAPGHNIIFEGANATYDTTGGDLWEAFTDQGLGIVGGDGIYRTKAAVTQPWLVFCEPTLDALPYRLPDVTSGKYWQLDMSGAKSYSTGLATLKARADAGEYAFCWNSADGKLYVRLKDGVDPDSVRVKLPNAALGSCLDVGLMDSNVIRYVVVDNLRIQGFLGSQLAYLANGGIGAQAVDGLVIKNCDVRGTAEFLKGKASSGLIRRNIVVKNCQFRNAHYNDVINWYHLKGSPQENVAVTLAGRGCALLDSVVQGVFNGWTSYGTMTQPTVWDGTQTSCVEAVELDNNQFYDIGDDAIEPEQFCLSLAFTRNVFRRCYKGVSMAPVSGGPVFGVRNIWHGRGEFQSSADKQSFLKYGNYDPGDTAFKLFANNTIVNLNDDATDTGKVLVGIADSGGVSNAYTLNNYVASDGFSVDFGYGAMISDVVFNGNVYRQRRPLDNIPRYSDVNGAPAWMMVSPPLGTSVEVSTGVFRTVDQYWYYMGVDKGAFATIRRDASLYGETSAVGGQRNYDASNQGFIGWKAGTPSFGSAAAIAWPTGRNFVFDPDSQFYVGTHDLINPEGGDFRPATDSTAVAAGIHLDNITRDVGPGWADYDEGATLKPTVGALLEGDALPNQAPVVTVTGATTGVVDAAVSGTYTATDPDGTTPDVTGTLTTPSGPSSITLNAGAWTFTPDEAGAYIVSISADDGYITTTRTHTVTVTAVPVTNTAPSVSATGATVTMPSAAVVGFTVTDPDSGDSATVAATLLTKPSASTRSTSDLVVAYNATLKTGTVTLTPDVAGDYSIRITATDESSATGSATAAVVVASQDTGGGGDTGGDTGGGQPLAGQLPTQYAQFVVITAGDVLTDPDEGTSVTWRVYPHNATTENGYILSGAATRVGTGQYLVTIPMSEAPLAAERGYAVMALAVVDGVARRYGLPMLIGAGSSVDRVAQAVADAVESLSATVLSGAQRTEVAYSYEEPNEVDNAIRHVGDSGTKVNYMRYRVSGTWYYDWYYYNSDADTKVAFIRTFTVAPQH